MAAVKFVTKTLKCLEKASFLLNKRTYPLCQSTRKVPLPTRQLSTTSAYCDDSNASRPVGRYAVPDINTLPEDLQERMKEVEEQSGFMPNVFSVFSRRPAEFRPFFDYYDAIMEKETGNLSKADREMIVVATSAANNCLYCVVAHSALHRIYSKNPILADQLATNWKLAELDERQKAILRFAMAVCHSETMTDEHFSDLEQHGLDREDAWDIGVITAFFALSNRMAHLTDLRPNDEFHLLGRIKKPKKED